MTTVVWTDASESSATLTFTPSTSSPSAQIANAGTLMWERGGNHWWREIIFRIASEVRRYPVTEKTLNSALNWLAHLPGGIPSPHVGAGDDGTISIEWDRNGNHLHVMFEDGYGEVFFQGSNGDEWETSSIARRN